MQKTVVSISLHIFLVLQTYLVCIYSKKFEFKEVGDSAEMFAIHSLSVDV